MENFALAANEGQYECVSVLCIIGPLLTETLL